MILIPKKGCNEIKYDSDLAKKLDYVIIINDEESSNVGDLFSIWNQKCKVEICNDISDYYDFIKKQDKINKKCNITIIGTKNVKYEQIIEYKNLTEFFLSYKEELKVIDKGMNKINNSFIDKNDNAVVKDLLDKFIYMNSGGKYIRAFLISLGYHIASKTEDDYYIPLATAYETFQTSILVHDDIIDKANMRRGKKTIPTQYIDKFNKYDKQDEDFDTIKVETANSMAICAGDIGFFLTTKIIVDNYAKNDNLDKILSLYNDVLINTGKGEVIDVLLPFVDKYSSKYKVKESDVYDIYRLKTAWYTIIGPFSLGLLLGGMNSKTLNNIRKVFEPIGIAFQIKDDILGIYANEKNLGKNNSDIKENKQTILYSYVINKTDYKEDLLKYYGKSELSAEDINKVKEIFEKSGALEYATKKMDSLFEEGRNQLKNNRKIPTYYKEVLSGLITYLELRDK